MTFSRKAKREYVLSALDKFERHLTRYAERKLSGNTDLAADVVQFAFMKLCEQNDRKPDGQLKAWLYTVCRNRIVDLVRKNGRLRFVEPDLMNPADLQNEGPGKNVEDRERLEMLQHRINKLPDQDREVIDLWSHGLKHQEIANVTSKKPGAIRVQLHRVIQLLKKEMGVEKAHK